MLLTCNPEGKTHVSLVNTNIKDTDGENISNEINETRQKQSQGILSEMADSMCHVAFLRRGFVSLTIENFSTENSTWSLS